jgi:glycerophosphoryl diester phosphodiesterase
MRLIAHRGGRGFGTDNTLDAMMEAVRRGVRAIETDIRATADGKLIVCHDNSIWGRVVARTTYAELKKHALERPLFSEILESLAGWVSLDIEIKEAPPREVGEMLDLYGLVDDTMITSFDRTILAGYKRDFPLALTGYLYRMPYNLDKKLDRALAMGAGVLAPHYNSIDEDLVSKAHDHGLQVYAWTVNQEDDFRKLYSWGVDAVITDRYFEIKELLREIESEAADAQSS